MPQPRWKGQLGKQNKLHKSSNFAVNAKHAIEEQSQYLAHKNPTHIQHMVEEQHQFSNLVHIVF